MKQFLMDDWIQSGTSIEEFKEVIEKVASKTKFLQYNSKELIILSFDHVDDNGKFVFHAFDPVAVPSVSKRAPERTVKLNLNALIERGDFSDFIHEVTNDVGIMFFTGKRCFFVSKKVLTQRLQPFGLNGDFLSEKSYERDLLIARQFGTKSLFRTLVAREDKGTTKIFSMLGERYRQVPQNVLVTVYDELTKNGIMGTPECKFWEMDHFVSKIRIEFPEKAEEFQTAYGLPEPIIPGLFLETSDTGDCSVKVMGTWRIRNSTTLHAEVAKRHSGNLDVEGLIDEVGKEIFADYAKLPEALCELMALDVTDPSWDLTKPRGQAKNRNKVEDVLREAFKKLKIVSAVGKKTELSLFQQLLLEFDGTVAYTAYDVAMGIMSMGDRVNGLHPLTQEKLAKAVGKAPFIKYEGKKSTPTVVLTA